MALTSMSLSALHLDFGDSVDFDFNDFSAGCSTGSISGSSYASSSFGPHTPTSGRSTPPFSTSMDFGSSFASPVDTVPFDMTPPSSARSTYFPTTPKTGILSEYVHPVFPVTPSRGQLGFPGHPLSSSEAQLTPAQTAECGFFMNELGPSPLMSTSSASAQFPHIFDSTWMHTESPISFEQQSSAELDGALPSLKLEQEDNMTTPLPLSDAARKRAGIGEARHKTTALHQAQQRSQASTRRQIKREKRLCALKADDGGHDGGHDGGMAVDNVEPRSKHYCPHPGCKCGPYQRKEHLIRHIESIHDKGKVYKCNWCKHTSNRRDNMNQHLRLHTRPEGRSEGKPRVDYSAGAVLEFEEVQRNNRARRRRSVKPKPKPEDSLA